LRLIANSPSRTIAVSRRSTPSKASAPVMPPRSMMSSRDNGSPASVSNMRKYSRLGAGWGYFKRSCS